VERRAAAGIESIRFARAGMNAHISRDLPVAMASTRAALAASTAPASRMLLAV
jgi:hypothetical protein